MISAHSEPVVSVCFSSDGMTVLSGSWDGYCRIWLALSGICLTSIDLHGVAVCHAVFTPNSAFVLISLKGSTLQLVRVADTKVVAIYSGHVNNEYCLSAGLCRARDGGAEIYASSEDGKIIGWNVNSRSIEWSLGVCDDPLVFGSVSYRGDFLVAGGTIDGSGVLIAWNRTEMELPVGAICT
jgi:COMPASS component SWD3